MKEDKYTFPDPNESPKKKGEKSYILKYGKAMYYQFNKYGTKLFFNNKTEYKKLAAYAQGNQPIDVYKKRLDCWENEQEGGSVFVNINWQILKVANKFINLVTGKLNQQEYDIVATPVDPLSVSKRQEKLNMMKAYIENRQFLQSLGITMAPDFLGFDPSKVPDDLDQLEMYMAMHEKEEMAMQAEMAALLVMSQNDFSGIREEYLRDLIIYGIGAVEVRNEKSGKTKVQRIAPDSLIAGNSHSPDHKDINHAGYVKNITFTELKAAAGTQFSEEDYKTIYEKHATRFNVSDSVPYNSFLNDNQSEEKLVTTLRFYYKTTNTYRYEKKKDSRGNKRLYPTTDKKGKSKEYKEKYLDTGEREIINDTYEVVYEGTWIVGTDYIYNYGPLQDMEVSPENYNEARIPIHIYAPGMLNGRVISVAEACIPIFDEIQINWLQYQNVIGRFIPDGHALDLDAMVSAPLGKGGKAMTPKQMIQMFYKTGTYVYRGGAMVGQNGNGKPIDTIKSSDLTNAEKFLGNIVTLLNLLNEIIGLNDATNASTPNPDVLVGTQKFSFMATENALDYLKKGDKAIFQHVAESCVKMTQLAVKRGQVSGLINSLGNLTAKFWEVNKDLSLCEVGIGIEPRPTQEEWQDFYIKADTALKTGSITLDDYALCKDFKNLKQAWRYLAIKDKQRKAEAQKMNEDNIKLQSEQNAQAGIAIEKAKQETIVLENKLQTEREVLLKKMDMEILQKKIEGELMLRGIDAQVKSDNNIREQETKVLVNTQNNVVAHRNKKMELEHSQSEKKDS
jgi:hypothetical protein